MQADRYARARRREYDGGGERSIAPNTADSMNAMKGLSMSAETRMREKLMIGLEPTRLDIVNESELHAGHRSSPGTGESHFRLLVVSPAFAGKSRVERHRMVNALLADELAGREHALALRTFAPDEAIAE